MGEQKGRMLRGEWYLDEPDLTEERRRCWRMLDSFNATGADDDAERHRILSGLLGKFAPGASVLPRFQCSYGYQISLGTNSFVNNDAIFMDDAAITIGDDPMEDHERRRAGWERPAPITIGDNAWLGGGVIVCPGVTIGENTVVGAGSVVVRDLPDHVFAAGNPARLIRQL